MGRELKRVALDFNWPLDKVYEGFINPFYGSCKDCPFCKGSGASPASKKLSDQWYGHSETHPFRPEDNGSVPLTIHDPAVVKFATKNAIQTDFTREFGFDKGIKLYWEMFQRGETESYLEGHPYLKYYIESEAKRLIGYWNESWSHHLNQEDVDALLADGRLTDFTRNPLNAEQKEEQLAIEEWNQAEREKMHADPKYKAEWRVFHNGYKPTAREVNDWHILSMGHDAINQWVCVRAKLKRLKLGTSKCAHCKGEGSLWLTPQYKKKADTWKRREPPKGNGYQLWSTTSEGSPLSPVFETLEALCEWCETNATTFAHYKATKEEWKAMLEADLVCHKEGSMILL